MNNEEKCKRCGTAGYPAKPINQLGYCSAIAARWTSRKHESVPVVQKASGEMKRKAIGVSLNLELGRRGLTDRIGERAIYRLIKTLIEAIRSDLELCAGDVEQKAA